MPAIDNFRANLRRALDELGVSQRELARRADMGYPYISRVLQGHTSPTVPQCERIAEALEIQVLALFGEPEDFSLPTA